MEALETGLIKIKGKWYWFEDNGVLSTKEWYSSMEKPYVLFKEWPVYDRLGGLLEAINIILEPMVKWSQINMYRLVDILIMLMPAGV